MEGVRVKAFNPEPFISMIEDTINDLDELRDENDINLLTISSECKNAEVAHASAMRSLSNSMDSIFSTFRRLDKRISKVSHTAVSIGHSLETLNYQKKQNILGKSIIQHFIDFNTGDINKIDPLFLTKDPVRIHEAARLIQLLQGVVDELKSKDNNKSRPASTSSASSSLPPPPSSALGGEEKGGGSSNSNSNATSFSSSSSSSSATTSTTTTTGSGTSPLAKAAELITKVSEMIEGTLRERFAESTKLGEDAKSYRVACTLVNFKNHVFDTYIAEAAIALDDHIRNSRKEAPSLKSFSANIRKICKVVLQVVNEQVSRVGRIFPNPMSIMHQIIINMFQFKIKPYVGSVLSDRSVVEDPEKYLRILNVAVVQMRELTQEIVESLSTLVQQQQQLQQQQQQLQQQAANGGLLSPVSSTSTSTSAASTLLSPTNSSSSSSTTTATSTSYGNQSWVSASAESVALSDQISLMFDTHFRGWAVKEVDLLQTVADEQLRVRRATAAGHFVIIIVGSDRVSFICLSMLFMLVLSLHRSSGYLSMNSIFFSFFLQQIEKSREDQMQEEKDLFGRTRKVPMSGPKRISWLQEMLSNDMVDRVIKQALTAAKRSDSLAPLGEQASAVESIYMTLLNFLHQRFLLPLLVESFDLLPPQDPKERPDHFFFVVVQLSNEISAKAHRFYVKYVAPRIADSPNVRSVLEMRMHHSKADVEKRIILGLQACLLAATNYCRRLLSQQKSNAYKPRDENTVLDADRVSAWSPMCAFVDSLLATALCTLLGSNLDRFLHVSHTQCSLLL